MSPTGPAPTIATSAASGRPPFPELFLGVIASSDCKLSSCAYSSIRLNSQYEKSVWPKKSSWRVLTPTLPRRTQGMATNLVRYELDGAPYWGVASASGIAPLDGGYPTTAALIEHGEADWRRASARAPSLSFDSAVILSPVTTPCRIYCQGANYRQHMIAAGALSMGAALARLSFARVVAACCFPIPIAPSTAPTAGCATAPLRRPSPIAASTCSTTPIAASRARSADRPPLGRSSSTRARSSFRRRRAVSPTLGLDRAMRAASAPHAGSSSALSMKASQPKATRSKGSEVEARLP